MNWCWTASMGTKAKEAAEWVLQAGEQPAKARGQQERDTRDHEVLEQD